jgi:hypothetical protein
MNGKVGDIERTAEKLKKELTGKLEQRVLMKR